MLTLYACRKWINEVVSDTEVRKSQWSVMVMTDEMWIEKEKFMVLYANMPGENEKIHDEWS